MKLTRLLLLLVFVLGASSAYSAKKADSSYIKTARYADISNEFGTASVMIHESYNKTLIFQTFKGYNVAAEYVWNSLQVAISDQIVVKGKDAEGNDCKLKIKPSGKDLSLWIERRNKEGKLIEDTGIREIGAISFGNSQYDYRQSKNVSSGFKLLKEWLTEKLM